MSLIIKRSPTASYLYYVIRGRTCVGSIYHGRGAMLSYFQGIDNDQLSVADLRQIADFIEALK